MASTYLFALKRKKELLDQQIREEMKHASHDEFLIRRKKEEKLHIKEQIARLEQSASA